MGVLVAMAVSICIGCGNTTDTITEVNTELDNGFYNENLTEEYMQEIINKKNKDVEITINDNGYSQEELDAIILSTYVFCTLQNNQNGIIAFSGNIYDITDDYIYILTCNHGIVRNSSEKEMEHYDINNMQVKFIIGHEIDVNLNNILIDNKYDLALIMVETKDIPKETLEIIKSINIENLYKKDFINVSLYLKAYSLMNGLYESYYGLSQEKIMGSLKVDENTIDGCSGGGFFDVYGHYYVVRQGVVVHCQIFPNFYELILQLNPNYGEPIESSTE